MSILPPTSLIIFGATGDLTLRKLIPALVELLAAKQLPTTFRVFAFSRRDWTTTQYRDFVQTEVVRINPAISKATLKQLLRSVEYVMGTFDEVAGFEQLRKMLLEFDQRTSACSQKLFYVSVAPHFYTPILEHIKQANLHTLCQHKTNTRIMIEKPFGNDVKSAQALDKQLQTVFAPEQIVRIDHYLAKETLQNILLFRFSNRILEPIWNAKYIERIEIELAEQIDIEDRGEFYDKVGALVDMGQSHILQVLAAVTMEDPHASDAESITRERLKILQHLVPMNKRTVATQAIRGQYRGYTRQPGVARDSQTETYFKIKTQIHTDRWHKVPIILESGKALSEKKTEIRIFFKPTISSFCKLGQQQCMYQNILTFRLHSEEEIDLLFWAKKPGLTLDVEPQHLYFSYPGVTTGTNAYTQVFFDAISGEFVRFTSAAEVIAAWKFISSIRNAWDSTTLYPYTKGSNGPTKHLEL